MQFFSSFCCWRLWVGLENKQFESWFIVPNSKFQPGQSRWHHSKTIEKRGLNCHGITPNLLWSFWGFWFAGHVFFSEHCELEAPNRHPQAECHRFFFEIFVFPVQCLNWNRYLMIYTMTFFSGRWRGAGRQWVNIMSFVASPCSHFIFRFLKG